MIHALDLVYIDPCCKAMNAKINKISSHTYGDQELFKGQYQHVSLTDLNYIDLNKAIDGMVDSVQ